MIIINVLAMVTYKYGTTLAKVNGRLVLRLSESDILPFRFMNMVDNIETFIESNKKLAEDVAKKQINVITYWI